MALSHGLLPLLHRGFTPLPFPAMRELLILLLICACGGLGYYAYDKQSTLANVQTQLTQVTEERDAARRLLNKPNGVVDSGWFHQRMTERPPLETSDSSAPNRVRRYDNSGNPVPITRPASQ